MAALPPSALVLLVPRRSHVAQGNDPSCLEVSRLWPQIRFWRELENLKRNTCLPSRTNQRKDMFWSRYWTLKVKVESIVLLQRLPVAPGLVLPAHRLLLVPLILVFLVVVNFFNQLHNILIARPEIWKEECHELQSPSSKTIFLPSTSCPRATRCPQTLPREIKLVLGPSSSSKVKKALFLGEWMHSYSFHDRLFFIKNGWLRENMSDKKNLLITHFDIVQNLNVLAHAKIHAPYLDFMCKFCIHVTLGIVVLVFLQRKNWCWDLLRVEK